MLGNCALVGGGGIEFSTKIDDVVCVERIVEWTDDGRGRSSTSSSVGGAAGGHVGGWWSVLVLVLVVGGRCRWICVLAVLARSIE